MDKIVCNENIKIWALKSLKRYKRLNKINEYGKIINGLIGTADKFISDKNTSARIREELPELLAVEMEGAAVAQVAVQEKIPWIIIRVISDTADSSAILL